MIFEKSAVIKAPAQRVWQMLLDPGVMGACVPGVESINVLSDVEYAVAVQVKVAFISARFKVRTSIVEMRPPNYLRSEGTGEDSSLTSSLKLSSELFLTDNGDGTAQLRTRLNAELLGRLGTFGLNIIKTKVDRMWEEFSRNLAQRLEAAPDTAAHEQVIPAATAADPFQSGQAPRVWLDMDQATLDANYNQAVYAANRDQVVDRYTTGSEAARAILGGPTRHAYGITPIEQLDVYMAPRRGAPVQVFIHGGAWRSGVARDYAFFAELFVRAGVHVVVPDFAAVQDVDGSLLPMVDQVRRAIAWVHANADRFGGDPDRIYLTSHSSGAHLAACALTTDWRAEFGLPADVIKGGLCCSGMYELEPVRRSARREYVKFTDGMVDKLSPQRHLDKLNAPLILAYGSLESPEFQRQACEFAQAAQARGLPVELHRAEGYNHFEIIETLGNPYGVLGRAVLRQMKLGAA